MCRIHTIPVSAKSTQFLPILPDKGVLYGGRERVGQCLFVHNTYRTLLQDPGYDICFDFLPAQYTEKTPICAARMLALPETCSRCIVYISWGSLGYIPILSLLSPPSPRPKENNNAITTFSSVPLLKFVC